MSLSEIVAEYGVGLKFATDPKAISNLQKTLDDMEKRVQRTFSKLQKQNLFGNALFGLDTTKLSRDIQRSLDQASSRTIFRINNFSINDKALQSALQSAAGRSRTLNINPRVTGGGSTGNRSNAAQRGLISGNSRSPGVMWHSALAGGGILSGFGLRALNTTMQELQLLPVSMESVTGSKERSTSELSFINKLGNEVGATRRELAPEYTKFLASAMGTPLEGFAQSGFRSLTRYGKVMGLDQEAMKGTFKSITQMVSKQQILAEELKGQTAERLPAAVRLMAEAVTGGDTKKLFAMMKGGKLDPNTALPKFFSILEEKANKGWQGYTDTTRFQQNVSGKRFEDLLLTFGSSGGDTGFFRIWKSIADMLPQLTNLVKGLGGAFDTFSKIVERLTTILTMFDDWMENFYELSPRVQDGLQGLGLAFALFGTKVGRSMLPLTAFYMLLEDLAVYNAGGDSLIGRALDGKGAAIGALGALGLGVGGSLMGGGGDSKGKRGKGGRKSAGGFAYDYKDVGIIGGVMLAGGFAIDALMDYGDELKFENQTVDQAKASNLQKLMETSFSDPTALYSKDLAGPLAGRDLHKAGMPNVYNITVQTNNDNPQEHGMLIMRTMQNLTTGE